MRDEELSGEEGNSDDDDVDRAEAELSGSEDEEELADETVDETRLRLAKKYLDTVKKETDAAEEEEDNFNFNQDAIAHRLQADVSEAKGRQYRLVADKVAAALPLAGEPRFLRGHKLPVTAVCLSSDDSLCFSASKDGQVIQWDLETGAKSRIYPTDSFKHGPPIHALATSTDGKYLAMGGKDCLVHVYDIRQRCIAQSFKGHRDAVSCLTFRRGTHQLFSGSLDRTIKVWNLDEMCYVESLFGHQDQITSIDSLMRERCVSSGRDRTQRLWKIVEESHLILRGHTASIDSVSMSTEEWFCGGSQDGGFSLWSTQKKKPTAMKKPAHGRDENGVANWIASCSALAYTDLVASGSCDGVVRLWKCSNENAVLEEIAQLPMPGYINALAFANSARFVVAGVGQEHRLGRWRRIPESKNGIAIFPLLGEKSEKDK